MVRAMLQLPIVIERKGGRADSRTDRRTDGWINGRVDGCLDGWMVNGPYLDNGKSGILNVCCRLL